MLDTDSTPQLFRNRRTRIVFSNRSGSLVSHALHRNPGEKPPSIVELTTPETVVQPARTGTKRGPPAPSLRNGRIRASICPPPRVSDGVWLVGTSLDQLQPPAPHAWLRPHPAGHRVLGSRTFSLPMLHRRSVIVAKVGTSHKPTIL